MLHASPDVRDTVADHDVLVSPASTPLLDQELADDRRAAVESAAGTFDPLGLYGLEQERDEAVNDLVANLPAGASVRLAHHVIVQRHAGQWETIDGWVAAVGTPDGKVNLSENGERPLVAAERLLNAWRRSRPSPRAA